MRSPETLQLLKAQFGDQAPVKARKNYGSLPGAPDVTVQAGQVIEVLGSAPFQWVVRFLSAHSSARAAWLSAEKMEVLPIALAQESIALSRVLFLERVSVGSSSTGEGSSSRHSGKGLATLLTLLRSGLFQFLIFDQALILNQGNKGSSLDTQLRKLQIAAEDDESVLVMLSKFATRSYGIHFQVETRLEGEVKMKKVKGGASF